MPQYLFELGPLVLGQGGQLLLQGDEMDHGEDADVVKESRDGCNKNDFKVGDPGDFSHDKGPCAHDGRHDLPPHAGHGLNGCCLFGFVAGAHHEGDGEGPRRIDVRHCGPRDGPVQGGSQDGHLCGPASGPAGQPEREGHQKIAGPGEHHDPGKEDVDIEEFHRDAGEKAEHPVVRAQIKDLCSPRQRNRLKIEHARPVFAGQEIGEYQDDGGREPLGDGTSHRFQAENRQEPPQDRFHTAHIGDREKPLVQPRGLHNDVDDGCQATPYGENVENARPGLGRTFGGREEDINRGQKNEEVNAADGPGLRPAETGPVIVQPCGQTRQGKDKEVQRSVQRTHGLILSGDSLFFPWEERRGSLVRPGWPTWPIPSPCSISTLPDGE